jgi:hypothetical protein
MERHPRLGATGLIYAVDWPHARFHLGAGSMLLRREDLDRVGDLRGTPCECSYLRLRLLGLGKEVVPLTRLHAHQWKRTNLDGARPEYEQPEQACPLCGELRNPPARYTDVEIEVALGEPLPRAELERLVAQHGDGFRVFVRTRPAPGG